MGSSNVTARRVEKKYLLSAERYQVLRERLDPMIEPDEFFSSTVCSLYYDTRDYEIIRRSIEKPVYKEKLRMRSYNVPGDNSTVFVELKKKYKGVVFKRRITMKLPEAEAYLSGRAPAPKPCQISREIDWFLKTNDVIPRVFIGCDRQAFVAKDDHEVRITFDHNIRWRDTDLDLRSGADGQPVTEPGQVLMELKCAGGLPLWLAHLLSELKIYPQGFSKYGIAYKTNLIPKFQKILEEVSD